ncbi:MAG: DUF4956 domain-containing protein [Clostridiales Family XIII bacterium]|nr:DUF4956 domain-containing protein [Clostridiales Family XIII bacterium]
MREILSDYLSAQTGAFTVRDIVLRFVVALILGVVIYISYRFSFSGAVYSARFNVSLVMLTLTGTLVMSVIGNNVALSLGMVGALSIVRFRTAIKDARDTAYVFWCIAVGICCGVSEFLVAGVGTAILFFFLLLFGAVRRNDQFLLIVRGDQDAEQPIEAKVGLYFDNKAQIKVLHTAEGSVEYIFALSEAMLAAAKKKNASSIVDVLRSTDGIHSVQLVSQNDEINR